MSAGDERIDAIRERLADARSWYISCGWFKPDDVSYLVERLEQVEAERKSWEFSARAWAQGVAERTLALRTVVQLAATQGEDDAIAYAYEWLMESDGTDDELDAAYASWRENPSEGDPRS